MLSNDTTLQFHRPISVLVEDVYDTIVNKGRVRHEPAPYIEQGLFICPPRHQPKQIRRKVSVKQTALGDSMQNFLKNRIIFFLITMLIPEGSLYTQSGVCKEFGGHLRKIADDFQDKKLCELERERSLRNFYQFASLSAAAILVGGIVWRWLNT